jgi:broad specificity phosphatase PhoE
MPKLILIKHASPYVIPGTPPERWRLSDKGIESCGPLAERLRPHAPGVVVTSSEPKAAQTGQLVADQLNVPVEEADGLQEHDRSNVPHMRSGEFISHVELFFRRPRELILGRETAEQAAARFNAAVDAVLK